jgi:hypothetical protein
MFKTMTINKTKFLAALFVISGSIFLISNDLELSAIVLILKAIGLCLFFYAIAKKNK